MFTGLVEALGTVTLVEPEGPGRKLVIAAPTLTAEMAAGDSLAVNGACLTVIDRRDSHLSFQAGPETLQRTNLGGLRSGDRVNLERPLRLGDRLDGHLVQGHVDGIGRIADRIPQNGGRQGNWELVWFTCPEQLAGQMIPKGSVAVDGVSLTLVDVAADRFSVALIPHTLASTTLGFKRPGAAVNLETDLFGKYVWKYLQHFSVADFRTRTGD